MTSPKTTATIIGVIVLATLIWAGASYRLIDEPEAPRVAQEQVAGIVGRDQLTIGVVGPLTGEYRHIGQAIREGIELAQSESEVTANIIFEDSQCNAEEAVHRMNKLISQNQVHAVIGDACLDATLAAAPVAEQHQVVLINPTLTDIKLTGAGSYLYRTVPTDKQAGSFTARLLYNDGRRRLALITDDTPTSLSYSRSLMNSWENYGAVIASENIIRSDGASTSNISLNNIAPTADAILLIASTPESAALLVDQAPIEGTKLPLYGNISFSTLSITTNYADAVEGMAIVRPHQGSDQFQAAYLDAYGHTPLPYAAQTYDALKALITAYADGRDGLKPNLDELNMVGTTGLIRFNDLGNVGNNFEIAIIKEGKLEPVK